MFLFSLLISSVQFESGPAIDSNQPLIEIRSSTCHDNGMDGVLQEPVGDLYFLERGDFAIYLPADAATQENFILSMRQYVKQVDDQPPYSNIIVQNDWNIDIVAEGRNAFGRYVVGHYGRERICLVTASEYIFVRSSTGDSESLLSCAKVRNLWCNNSGVQIPNGAEAGISPVSPSAGSNSSLTGANSSTVVVGSSAGEGDGAFSCGLIKSTQPRSLNTLWFTICGLWISFGYLRRRQCLSKRNS